MAKVLVLYYSMYGHIETMAHAVAEGAQKVDGVEVTVKRVPETMSGEAFLKAGGKTQNITKPHRKSLPIMTLLFWHSHSFWQYGRPDAHIPRPNWRLMGIGRFARQACQRV